MVGTVACQFRFVHQRPAEAWDALATSAATGPSWPTAPGTGGRARSLVIDGDTISVRLLDVARYTVRLTDVDTPKT